MVGGSGPVGSGISNYPINATEGKGAYFQSGYYFRDWKIQPWAGYEFWHATNPLGRWAAYRLGLSYFFKVKKLDASLKLGYERVNTDKDIGSSEAINSGKDSINTVVLSLYLTF
jgi:hypothetical protein